MAQPVCRSEHVGRPEDLALVHGQAAGQLAQILVGKELCGQGLGFAEVIAQRPRPDRRLPKSFGIGRRPGETVGGMLLGVEGGPVKPAILLDAAEHGGLK